MIPSPLKGTTEEVGSDVEGFNKGDRMNHSHLCILAEYDYTVSQAYTCHNENKGRDGRKIRQGTDLLFWD